MRVAATCQKGVICHRVIQTPLQQKYVRKLMGFDFVIEYKAGASNQVADALSRVFEVDEEETTAFMSLSQPLVGLIDELKKENETLELRQIHQKLDQNELLVGFQQEHRIMEMKVNRKWRDVEFNMGDTVLVKLKLYQKDMLARRLSNKLAKRGDDIVLLSSPEEATWEWLLEFQCTYPSYHLEDKMISER
nr:Ty3/gypsy retrotransposon protein [Tanacetum cinerariifolium]